MVAGSEAGKDKMDRGYVSPEETGWSEETHVTGEDTFWLARMMIDDFQFDVWSRQRDSGLLSPDVLYLHAF